MALDLNSSVEELLSSSLDEFMISMKTSQLGLTDEEAQTRLSIYGYNELAKRKRRIVIVDFLLHFKSPLVIMLLLSGLISGLVGEITDASLILIIIILSGVLDFYQEFRAEKAAEMLKEKVATTATIVREGSKREVKITEVVPGDVVFLSAGSIVPADARIITAADLSLDQSSLTGESFPVAKTVTPLEKKSGDITEWNNCLFMGTSVVGGSGTAVIVKTGTDTEYGRIVQKLVARQPEKEFERGLRRFGTLIAEAALLLVLLVFAINALFKHDILEALLFSVALAVGLVPELLPMMLSVNLSKGAVAMSKKGVIVKKLASIQDFGSMDTICTDKTGTLTENKMALRLHVDMEGQEAESVLMYCSLNSFFETGLKSPLDEAILEHEHFDFSSYIKVSEIPFDFVRRRLSVIAEHEGQRIIITKGAPEEVFKVCSSYELHGEVSELTSQMRAKLEEKYNDLSREGYRVLGVAYRRMSGRKQNYSISDERERDGICWFCYLY